MLEKRHITNRIKLYCDPKIQHFLTENWLHMSFWDGIFYFPSILAQLGISGITTAYGDTEVLEHFSFEDKKASKKDDEFSVYFVNSPKKVTTIRFFRDGDKELYSCLIPGERNEYKKNFALVEKKEGITTYFFYDLTELTWDIFPCFIKEIHKNGTFYMDANESDYIRATFEVKRPLDCTLFLTIIIKNDESSKKIIDFYKENILKILNTEKTKSLYTQYEKINRFIGHITTDYFLSCKTKDGKITDELVISDGSAEKFMITRDEKKITLFKSQNWEMKYKNITIKCKDHKISFPNSEFSFTELKRIEKIVSETDSFIRENMLFAFEAHI